MRAVVSVIGKDMVGILAKVSVPDTASGYVRNDHAD